MRTTATPVGVADRARPSCLGRSCSPRRMLGRTGCTHHCRSIGGADGYNAPHLDDDDGSRALADSRGRIRPDDRAGCFRRTVPQATLSEAANRDRFARRSMQARWRGRRLRHHLRGGQHTATGAARALLAARWRVAGAPGPLTARRAVFLHDDRASTDASRRHRSIATKGQRRHTGTVPKVSAHAPAREALQAATSEHLSMPAAHGRAARFVGGHQRRLNRPHCHLVEVERVAMTTRQRLDKEVAASNLLHGALTRRICFRRSAFLLFHRFSPRSAA